MTGHAVLALRMRAVVAGKTMVEIAWVGRGEDRKATVTGWVEEAAPARGRRRTAERMRVRSKGVDVVLGALGDTDRRHRSQERLASLEDPPQARWRGGRHATHAAVHRASVPLGPAVNGTVDLTLPGVSPVLGVVHAHRLPHLSCLPSLTPLFPPRLPDVAFSSPTPHPESLSLRPPQSPFSSTARNPRNLYIPRALPDPQRPSRCPKFLAADFHFGISIG
ncbi:hypothetical protein R3P38DRAFT_3245403 [Favolaschia claudopus]|uniref:Uncharacterized protein n=1 Tax=Favolaschia claudopus TaxID=2862362 RepID=A0AAV9Z0G2_9AGAR